MSILLFGVGALAALAGVAMVGYGIPINEFSFGNTLIVSGTVAIVGGLLIAGLGAAVSYLQRIADALTNKAPARANRPFNTFEQPAGARSSAAPARVPFPPKMKAEPKDEAALREPAGFEPMTESPFARSSAQSSAMPSGMPFKEPAPDYFAPSLPNPDEPPVTVEDEVSLSPRYPMAPAIPAESDGPNLPPPPGPSFSVDEAEGDEIGDQMPKRDAGRRLPPLTPLPVRPVQAAKPVQNAYFDAMWPAEPKADDERPAEPKWESKPPVAETLEPAFEPPVEEPPRDEEPPTVAILKSGVVDGMGYTLYVDGSIEAELPQGTLRFASITELRQHLEKTS
jgi:hypothetical protein